MTIEEVAEEEAAEVNIEEVVVIEEIEVVVEVAVAVEAEVAIKINNMIEMTLHKEGIGKDR